MKITLLLIVILLPLSSCSYIGKNTVFVKPVNNEYLYKRQPRAQHIQAVMTPIKCVYGYGYDIEEIGVVCNDRFSN